MRRFLLLVVVLFSISLSAQKQPANLKGSKTMEVTYLGTSPKLSKITPIPSRTRGGNKGVYIVPNKLTKTGKIKQILNKGRDPVMQKTASVFERMGSTVKVGFNGGSNQDNANVNGIQVAPPDTQGDVGPNHYVQMTNSVTTIFDKSGNTLFGPAPNSVFFQNLDPRLAGTNDGDPIVVYDEFEDRWIVSQFAVSEGAPYFMLIAVSQTSDPTGSYNQYAIDYGFDFPDYPKLGIWNEELYITTRDFNDFNGFEGFSLVAINKFDMYNGEPTSAQRFEIDDPEFDGILPADADGPFAPPAGEPHYSLYLSASGNSLNLITTTIDFDNPANSTLVFGSIPVATYSFFQTQVPQPNGQTLDVLPFFLMYRLQYVNFGAYASMLTNHSVQESSGAPFGIRWYEFRNTGVGWDVYQQGTYEPNDGLNRWMGSIAMNKQGDIALGYSVANDALAPSIRFVGQTANESGTGIMNVPENSILEGTLSSRGTNRWGDYSMMSIDPTDDDFWFTTEYIAQDAAFSGWGTFISEMVFGDPPTAICQDITVELDATIGSVSITPEQIDDGSIGPDGGEVTLTLDIDTFDCSNIGENIVTLTATSADGITASCTAIVTVNVIDEEAPVAVCQDIFVELNGESVEITPEQVDGGSTDNCTIASFSVDQSVFTEIGTFPVILTVTDAVGLTDTCEATVTVAEGAMIEVNPTSITAAVDLKTDIPPVVEEVITVSNNGGVPLNFDIEVGIPEFIPPSQVDQSLADLDRSVFKGNTSFTGTLKSAGIENPKIGLPNSTKTRIVANSAVVDSIFYDSGVDFPGDFVGFDDTTISQGMGVRFDVPGESFKLTAVRNAYRTEAVTGATILLSIYKGGDLPEEGELLLEQVLTGDSADGVFAFEQLNTPLNFSAGEHFWVVHTYPIGIAFPQGFDDTIDETRPNTYAFSSDGGTSFTLFDGFASLVRALSEGQDNSFISLSPETGTVAPGESVDILVAFNGDGLANGVYNTDININSNDSVNPTVTVPTAFTVTGQTSEIEVSEELLLFNDVFVGNTAERSFIISNIGGGDLNISSITSDNEEFSANPSFGSIPPGGELEIVVTYEPTAIGSSNGILSIVSDAENADVVNVVVNGVGVEGPFAVLDPEQNLVSVPSTESTQVDITLRNDGGSPLTYSFPEFTMAAAIANGAELQRAEVLDFPNFSATQPKGFEDSRIGAPVRLGMGTDLTFGYTWMDSDEAGGPIPGFIDIIPFGATDLTDFLVSGDFADGTVSLDLPYTLPFYGDDYGSIFVNANGFVSFEEPTGFTFVNGQIPVEDGVNNIIAPFWADLEPGTGNGGTVHIAAFADAVVVQWTDAPGFNAEGSVTFQVIIFTDGTIDVQYEDVSSASFLQGATVGIENTGATDGAQVAFNTDYVKDNFAVRFMPPSIPGANFITGVSPLSGVLGVGQQETITVTVDAAELEPGVFLDELVLSSNTVNMDRSTATFELTVTEGPLAELSPEFVQETVVTGESVQTEITVRNSGGGTLNYSFPEFTMAAAIANGAELQQSEVIDFPNFSKDQPKGFADTRTGAPVRFGMGTDLEFGYTWMDSDEAGGPIPGFIDITPFDFSLDLTADLNDGLFADGTVSLNLPYSIPFYGEEFSTIFVNANGFVSFEAPTGFTFLNDQIPVEDGVNNIIAPFWTDLEPGLANGGTVHIAAFADAVVVQWTNAPGFNTEGSVTFQVIIFIDGTIDVQYEDVSTASFLNNATVGIENTGATDGAQVAFNTEYVKDNFAVRFMPPAPVIPFITNVSPVSGSLGAGEEDTILVTLDASGLAPEVYLQDLVLSSNSTDVATTSATFELTVVEEPPFDNLPDSDVNLGLAEDAVLSGSVENGRGSLSEILYDPVQEDYFIKTDWNEYGVGFRENLGKPGPDEGLEWRVDWDAPKAINYITFGGTYTNQPQPFAAWRISYLSSGSWVILEEGIGGWIDSGIFEWDGTDMPPIVAQSLRVQIYSDGTNDLVSIHLRGRGGFSNNINDSSTTPKATLIQYLPGEGGIGAPVASFDFTVEGLDADFDASSSTDDVGIVGYSWDFGDGSTGTGEVTSHTYASSGSYEVTLTVTDDDGQMDSTTRLVSVDSDGPLAPVASFDFTVDGMDADFDGSSSTDDGSIVDYSWDFGDGSIGNGEMTSHTYTMPGTYDVTLTVTDNDGLVDSTMRLVTIAGDGDCNPSDNTPDAEINLALMPDAALSGSVSGGRGSLEEILYDPRKEDYFIRTPWNEYGVGFRENLGRPGPDEGFIWRVDWDTPKSVNYITFGGTYPNQPQAAAAWRISYRCEGDWVTLDEGIGGWIDSGVFEWDGRSMSPISMKSLRVQIYSDGNNDLVSIHLRARGGLSNNIDDSNSEPKATLIQYLPSTEDVSSPDALSTAETNGLNIYPNPARETVNMSFDIPTEVKEFQVFDLQGRLLRRISVQKRDGAYEMPVLGFPAGTYFIKTIDNKGQSFHEQMIIER